jgi:hypothetical protein
MSMPAPRARRLTLLTAAAVVTVAAVAAALLGAPSTSRFPGPLEVELADDLFDQRLLRAAEDALLRERLGGLAALVTDDDMVDRCIAVSASEQVAGAPAGADEPTGHRGTGTDQVAAVREATERIRELTLGEPVAVRLFDDTSMTDRVTELFARQWPDDRIEVELRKLVALGVVDPDTDLFALRVEAFAEQVSGYFAGGAGEIGVRTTDPAALSPLERVVLSHEFEHALTAAHLDRPQAGSADAARAQSALVEGSAALTMMIYARMELSEAERVELRQELLARAHADTLAGHSPYLRAQLQFPYVEGLRFVCARWLDGGWAAVDDAYADPPASTAVVMFPDRHGELPRQPATPGTPGDGWERVRDVDFGAAQLEWLLAAPGGDPSRAVDDPRSRAGAWDGGRLVVWSQHEATALALALVDRGEGPSLCESVRLWYEAAFPDASTTRVGRGATFAGDSQHAVVTCDGDQVRLGIAPVAAVSAAIAD